MAINTTKSINKPQTTDQDLQKQVNELGGLFAEEKKVKVSIPTALEKSIGSELFLGINGVSLVVPVDGEDHEIPETFAKHLKEFLKNLQN